MSKPRRPRPLSPEERRLWAHVARHVSPLKGRAHPEAPEPEPPPAPVVPEPPAAKGPIARHPKLQAPVKPFLPPYRPAPPPSPPLPPLAVLERRERQALRRGRQDVYGVIDLHGLRQAEAHGRLIAFLMRSQAAGHGLVLVITGKGGAAAPGVFEERGVLRRSVPHWLRLPDLRGVVLGFEEAQAPHGGSGALYVRLRRRRVP